MSKDEKDGSRIKGWDGLSKDEKDGMNLERVRRMG